ncbi:MAG: hypothetical protein KFB97_04400 [Cyanobium sp. M30B3]|nr:MAG: hypothetical protein KFB97_04400 [Cyanobium sp. M30B3]
MLHLPSPLRQPPAWRGARLPSLLTALLTALGAGPLAVPPALADAALEQCRALRQRGDLVALRDQQRRLQAGLPAEPGPAQALATAEALLACGASQAALAVLERTSPAGDGSRENWLLLQWRAAHGGLHHARAVDALALLAAGDLSRLESLRLPVAEPDRPDRPPRQRVALDLLADHLVSLEAHRQAAEVLLASREPGAATAARWGRAALLATHLPPQEREAIMERALEQAAAAEDWGLVAALLDQQLAEGVGDGASRRALERRLRLSERIDDAYGEWLQRRSQGDAAQDPRVLLLEEQLRSPRQDGGHAAPSPPSPLPQP